MSCALFCHFRAFISYGRRGINGSIYLLIQKLIPMPKPKGILGLQFARSHVQYHLGRDNSTALYAAAILIFVCSVAKGPQPGVYLAFRNGGDSGCLSLFIGIRSILETCNSVGSVNVLAIHASDSQKLTSQPETQEQRILSRSPSVASREYSTQLEQIRHLLFATFPTGDSRHASYSQVLDRLCESYHAIFSHSPLLTESGIWQIVFGRLYTLPDDFLLELQQQRPIALVFLAFFVVLLNVLDSVWFIHRWPQHIMEGIYQSLDCHYRRFVQWSMPQVLKGP